MGRCSLRRAVTDDGSAALADPSEGLHRRDGDRMELDPYLLADAMRVDRWYAGQHHLVVEV